jgi:ribosomal protein S27E
MSLASHIPFWSETAILFGAGASAKLGVPTTDLMGKTIRDLAEKKVNKNLQERISDVSMFHNMETELKYFLTALGDCLEGDGITRDSIEAAKKILPEKFSDEEILTRIVQWKSHYDWNALRRLAIKVPIENENYTTYLIDFYNIIDGSLLNNHGIQVQCAANNDFIFLYPHRLRAARNLLVLLSNLMMACAYHKTRIESPEKFKPYIELIEVLYNLMQREAIELEKCDHNMRDFYLMSFSIISLNFDPIFLWFRFYVNAILNKNPSHIGSRNIPVELYHDFAVFTAIKDRNTKKASDGYYPSNTYYPVNETIPNHVNRRNDCIRLYRICKFYFVHGSTNIRECENCGKMMLIWGDWDEMPEDLFSPPPFKTKLFERPPRTKEEKEAYEEGKYDFVQCPYCGNTTYAYNHTMIMQTAYKGGHTSFLEEIQRDAKISLSGAKHVILLGYQLPPDDAVWRSAIVAKQNENKTFCSVVVGYEGEDKWIKGEELIQYRDKIKKTIEKEKWADYGINAIDAAIAIFGKDKVRAYTGGIPNVWCSNGTADKDKVIDLLYPFEVFPNGVVNMRIDNWNKYMESKDYI